MKGRFLLAVLTAAGIGGSYVAPAHAVGCLSGGVAGAVAGHMVHHGVLGAVGGCIAGHEYHKHQQRAMDGSSYGQGTNGYAQPRSNPYGNNY